MLAAYFMGKITHRLNIGEAVGQLLGGVFVGPYLLSMVGLVGPAYEQAFSTFHFFIFLFLGLIAFSIGEELHIGKLKKAGIKAIIICFIQALTTGLLTFGIFLLLGYPLLTALIVGSIGIATAPATTFVLMNRLAIEGRLRELVANIVILSDVFELVVFSIFIQLALSSREGRSASLETIFTPVISQVGWAILLGIIVFFILKFMIRQKGPLPEERSERKTLGFDFLRHVLQEHPTPSVEVLLIIGGLLSVGVGICMLLNIPFLIFAVVVGILISNFHTHVLFGSLRIDNIMPVFNLLFFALIGANVRLDTIVWGTLLYVLAYIISRSLGKLGGTWLGCKITRQDVKIRRCLPRLMLPQAGVAAVEAYYVAIVLPGGETILQVILPALVFFEIAGIILSERTLIRWKSWTIGEEEILKRRKKIPTQITPQPIRLVNLISEDTIKIPLTASTKEGVISELLNVLLKARKIADADTLFKEIMEREKLASTGLGDGVAIPHAKSPAATTPVCAFGIKRDHDGIDFGSIDGRKANIFFLLVSPDDPSLHLKALAVLTTALQSNENRDALRKVSSTREVMGLFKRLDSD